MVVSLLPYSFLTYMPVVPSRHTYLAGVGLSLIVAAGFVALREQPGSRRSVVAGVALLILLHNFSYLWIRKQRQYIERAEPTELLVENLRDRQRSRWKCTAFPTHPTLPIWRSACGSATRCSHWWRQWDGRPLPMTGPSTCAGRHSHALPCVEPKAVKLSRVT